MKELTKISDTITHVVSEPGDGTRYNYYVYQDDDEFCFMPCLSTFRFPQRLVIWRGMPDFTSKELEKIARDEQCNFHTVRECVDTAKLLQEQSVKPSNDTGEEELPKTSAIFRRELDRLISRYSEKNRGDTPDFILRDYLCSCLTVFNAATQQREMWHGRSPKSVHSTPNSNLDGKEG